MRKRPPRRARPQRVALDPRSVVEALESRKAIEVTVLDLRGLSDAADYFIVASGTSDTHVRGMAEHVMEALEAGGHRLHHVEGLPQGRWVLLDYVDVVVHLFQPAVRDFYQLERLWSDAPVLSFGKRG